MYVARRNFKFCNMFFVAQLAKYAPRKKLEKAHICQICTKRIKFEQYGIINRDELLFAKVHYLFKDSSALLDNYFNLFGIGESFPYLFVLLNLNAYESFAFFG